MLIHPCVADKFYPGEANILRNDIQTMLAQTDSVQHLPLPKAMIVPHAGYVYSGTTAAAAYACLASSQEQIKSVLVLAPAHRYAVKGVVTTDASGYLTPLGEIKIDQKKLAATALPVVTEPFNIEHALEVQLPFLQVVLGNFMLIPLLVGETTGTYVAQVLTKLWNGSETLIVVSSDLSHYYPYHKAQELDQKTAQAILELNPCAIDPQHACGALAIQGLLTVAAAKHMTARQIALCNSGDTAGSQESVVGYGAFHFN